MTRLHACCAALLAAAGCASATPLPDSARREVGDRYEGRLLYLRSSVHVLPFFSERGKLLLSQAPPDSIELLNDTSGNPILPGEPVGLLPLGTAVRVEKVEFPTSLVVTRRPLYSPRTYPWIYLSTPNAPSSKPYIAVLPPGLKTVEQVEAAMEQLFSREDPAIRLQGYAPEVRKAIDAKELVEGMDSDAVALAWGRPEKISVQYAEGVRVETWTWPLGKRSATLRDGRLVSAKPPLSAAGNP